MDSLEVLASAAESVEAQDEAVDEDVVDVDVITAANVLVSFREPHRYPARRRSCVCTSDMRVRRSSALGIEENVQRLGCAPPNGTGTQLWSPYQWSGECHGCVIVLCITCTWLPSRCGNNAGAIKLG